MAAEPMAEVQQRFEALFRAGQLGGLTDGELLERFVAGSGETASAAFAVLVERHGPMVLRLCQRWLDDRHDAEDAAQATFLVLARRASRIRRGESVGSWLFGVAVRVARRARSEAARRRRVERQEGAMASRAIATSDGAADPAGEPAWAELYDELGRLPESLRAPLVLCYLEGQTNEQAAEQLGTSLRTLRRRLAKGRERLRQRLTRLGIVPAAVLLAIDGARESARSAPLPSAWADRTVRAALEFAMSGSAAGAGSGAAATLAQEVMRSMFRAKLRLALTAALMIGTVTLAGLMPLALGQKGQPDGPKPPRPDAPAPAVAENPQPEATEETPLPDFVTARPRTGPGRTTRLRIVAADTGAPVPNAHVRVWKAFLDALRTADAEGRITVEHSTGPADKSFSVDVWGDGFAMQRHHFGDRDEPIPDEATIKLQPGESLGGIVRDEQGRPVAGAAVYLWSHNYQRKDPTELLYDLRATTGADGRWRTGGAPETTGELLGFYITHPDYISDREYTTGREIPPIAKLRSGDAVSVLKKGPPIEGRVLDADGQPVAGAVVLSTTNPQRLFSSVKDFAVVTDAEGRFRTGQVESGEWHLLVRAPGQAPGAAMVKVETAIPQVEIRLGRPRPLKVRVLDPEGRPVAGVFLDVARWNQYRCLGVLLWTDDAGRARWDDAPDDELILNASARGYFRVLQESVQPSDEETVFTLQPAVTISGTVRDAETGDRIKRAQVEYGVVDPETRDVNEWVKDRPSNDNLRVLDGSLTARVPTVADPFKLRIVAEGYEPFVSRTFRVAEQTVYDYEVKLRPPGPGGPTATVLLPDGKPLADARVVVGQVSRQNINLKNGEPHVLEKSDRQLRTGPDGTFPIPPLDKGSLLFVIGERGWAYATPQSLEKSPRIEAEPLARVEGRYLIGDRPGANILLELRGYLQGPETNLVSIDSSHEATTDAEGRFAFDRVIPFANLRIARYDRPDVPGRVWTLGEAVSVAPGETARITYGGNGRPVVGRVAPPEDWTEPVDFTRDSRAGVVSNRARTPYPPELFRGKTTLQGGAWMDWQRQWSKTPEGRASFTAFREISVSLAPDGSFRIDDVPPGEYRLIIHVHEGEVRAAPGPFATISRTFTISPTEEGEDSRPLDFGLLRLRRRTILEAGQPAPRVEVTTVKGDRVAIPGDYRGRYLLLDLGTPHLDQGRLQIARVNGLHAKFGDDERLAMLSLIVATDDAETRRFVAEKGQPWPQAIVGPFPNPVAQAFGVEDSVFGTRGATLPTLLLIGPDGQVLARDFDGRQIARTLSGTLGR